MDLWLIALSIVLVLLSLGLILFSDHPEAHP